MQNVAITFAQTELLASASGALFWPAQKMLVVSDLHLGKSERIARLICLGDSFDDLMAQNALDDEENLDLVTMMAGRKWVWIEGNHDPGPISLGGTHLAEFTCGALTFRHIALTSTDPGEISGHYHPKAKLAGTTRPAFIFDEIRMILPAYGAYTGGLKTNDKAITGLMSKNATAILTGKSQHQIPMPR